MGGDATDGHPGHPGAGRVPEGVPIERCPACRLRRSGCICATLPRVRVPFELVLIRHRTEIDSPSNTGGLAARLLAPCSILEHGVHGRPFDPGPLTDAGSAARLLVPWPGAPLLAADEWSREHLEPRSRPTLVLLDATWSKARRMTTRIAALRGMPRRRLPASPAPALPLLRTPPAAERFSTLESVVRAAETLAPEAAIPLREAAGRALERILAQHGRERRRGGSGIHGSLRGPHL